MRSYLNGLAGEDAAIMHYGSLGFRPVVQRFRSEFGEIDFICTKENFLVFVEIKARKSSRMPSYEGIVTNKQLQRIYNSGEVFITQNPQYLNFDLRYDIIIVENNKIIMHAENISFI